MPAETHDGQICARCSTTVTAADRVVLLHGDLFHEQCFTALSAPAQVALTRDADGQPRKTIQETARVLEECRERAPDR